MPANGATTAEFYYDGKNRQIERNINGVIRFNSSYGWDLLEEWSELGSRDIDGNAGRPNEWERMSQYSSSLNVVTAYLQGSTGVIKSWSAANTLYYYQDKLGSTTHVANASGQLVESYHYDLYGKPAESSTHGVVDLYGGERWIPELGLYDLRNRFMSPDLGRFLQADPIGFKGDASNLYRYCHNDPVDRSDPMGLQATPGPTGSTIEERQRLFYGESPGQKSLEELDSRGGLRSIPREQAEKEMSPSGPLSESQRTRLDNGCNGLTSIYQGKGEGWPENAPGTKAHMEESRAHERVVGENQRNFVFAKQGQWRTTRPKPDPKTGEVPRNSITSGRPFSVPAEHT